MEIDKNIIRRIYKKICCLSQQISDLEITIPLVDENPTDGSFNAVSSNGVFDALALKQDTLGFTPENVLNKENITIDNSTTKYPTINLLKIGLDTKQDIIPNVQSILSSDAVTPVFGNDLVVITQQDQDLNLENPTGDWSEGSKFKIRIKDDSFSQLISFGTKYRAIGVTLPTATVSNKTIYLDVIYNETEDFF